MQVEIPLATDQFGGAEFALLKLFAHPGGHLQLAGSPHEVSHLLLAWSEGDKAARDQLMALVYGELRRLAKQHKRRERAGHMLLTTALIHGVVAWGVGIRAGILHTRACYGLACLQNFHPAAGEVEL